MTRCFWLARSTKEKDSKRLESGIQKLLRETFRPEFLNRIDETIIFEPLRKEQIRKIVVLQIEKLEQQLVENHYRLNISERAIDAISNEGYDPVYGARPLKRVIQRRLQNKIATELLRREENDGGSIHVDFLENDYQIKSMP